MSACADCPHGWDVHGMHAPHPCTECECEAYRHPEPLPPEVTAIAERWAPLIGYRWECKRRGRSRYADLTMGNDTVGRVVGRIEPDRDGVLPRAFAAAADDVATLLALVARLTRSNPPAYGEAFWARRVARDEAAINASRAARGMGPLPETRR